MGAREVGPWVGEQKPLGKSPLRGNPSPESTYLPTYQFSHFHGAYQEEVRMCPYASMWGSNWGGCS